MKDLGVNLKRFGYTDGHQKSCYPLEELKNGEWVKFDDVQKEKALAIAEAIIIIAEDQAKKACIESEMVTIDLEEEAWKQIKQAAKESSWIPKEYYMNDWLADVCNFLRNGVENGKE